MWFVGGLGCGPLAAMGGLGGGLMIVVGGLGCCGVAVGGFGLCLGSWWKARGAWV